MELQFFEDLELGGVWTTRRRTVTEADLAAFGWLTGNLTPLHVDAEIARQSPLGGRVAPATFVAAVAVGLGSIDVPSPASGGLVGMTWKFVRPIRPGDTVHAVWRLARKRAVEDPKFGLAVWHVDVVASDGVACAQGEIARLVQRRESSAEAAAAAGAAPSPAGRRRRGRAAGTTPVGAGAVPAVPADLPAIEPAPDDSPAPARRRRRRGGSSRPAAEAAEPAAPETAIAPPEAPSGDAASAPAEVPAPPRRRRRRGGSRPASDQPGPAPDLEPAPPQEIPAVEAPARRSRRRRSPAPSNDGGGEEPRAAAAETPAPAPVPAVAPAPAPAPEPPRARQFGEPVAESDPGGGIRGVLRRLRG